MTLMADMLGPYMLSFSNRTIFNETLTFRIMTSFIIQSCPFFLFSFFFFNNMGASPLNPTKFLTLSLEQQNSSLKSKFLSQQECRHVVDCDLFSAELCFRVMG